MDPVSSRTARERLAPCERRAIGEARSRGGTVVRAGTLRPRADGTTGVPAVARPRGDGRADIRAEIAEYRRLAARGLAPALLWVEEETGCLVVEALSRTLHDVLREQGGRLTAAQQRRLLALCTDPALALRPEHVAYASFVVAERARDGELVLIHPTGTEAVRVSGRRDHNRDFLRAILGRVPASSVVAAAKNELERARRRD